MRSKPFLNRADRGRVQQAVLDTGCGCPYALFTTKGEEDKKARLREALGPELYGKAEAVLKDEVAKHKRRYPSLPMTARRSRR